jgi:2'-5' RNA ligase
VESAVLLCVPEAEDLVGRWRDRGDPSAAAGVPAHVTLLTPFLPVDRIDAGVVAELEWFFRGVDAFPMRFERVGCFEEQGVVFLDPAGRDLDDLAAAFARRWPETPPYAGHVTKPHAHLTVVRSDDARLRAEAAAAVERGLPLVAVAAQAALWTCDEHGHWSEAHLFAFGAPEQP